MDKQSMHVDSITLFSRLVVIIERFVILSCCFKYEHRQFSFLLLRLSNTMSTNFLEEKLLKDTDMLCGCTETHDAVSEVCQVKV